MPFTIRKRCGYCKNTADLAFTYAIGYNQQAPVLVTEADRTRPARIGVSPSEQPVVTAYATALCPICRKPSLVLFRCQQRLVNMIAILIETGQSAAFGEADIGVQQIFPAPPPRDDHESWPEKVRELFDGAQRAFEERLPAAMVITSCRSILEVAATALGGSGRVLQDKINDLLAKGVITKGLADWAHALRLDGNAAVHEVEGSRDEAGELLAFIRLFLQVTFTLPADIAARRVKP